MKPGPGPSRPRTWQLFALLTLGQIASLFLLNEVVLTDGIYRSMVPDELPPAQAEDFLLSLRRGAALGYLFAPVGLLVRTGLAALCVHLVLLAFLRTPALARVFRAALWAQGALVSGALFHAGWLTTLPEGSITVDTLRVRPGSLGDLLSPVLVPGETLQLLLQQTHVFDIGWLCLFVLALEDGKRLPLLPAALSVSTVWLAATLLGWVTFLLLTRLG